MTTPYRDRADAGRRLAGELEEYAGRSDVVVLALPRGGVPVAFEVAEAIDAPLDLMIVRKLGLPGQEELAMGAIATGDVRVMNEPLVERLGLSGDVIEQVVERERRELHRRQKEYRGDRPPPQVKDKCVILIDDGLATGATMLAAAQAIRQLQPREIVVAVPVAPPDTCQQLEQHVDRVVCAETPWMFRGVGQWYDDFSQTSDREVRQLLDRAWARPKVGSAHR
jgi:putative phosphoribosyl transferase